MNETPLPAESAAEAAQTLQEVASQALIVLPTGELVDLSDPSSCAKALAAVREIESQVREVKGAIVDSLTEEAKRRGENTIELEDGTRIQVKRNYEVEWDTEMLEQDLLAAGMPEQRIREIVVETVSYTVKAVEANKVAKANPAYAEAIGRARSETERRPTISIPRG